MSFRQQVFRANIENLEAFLDLVSEAAGEAFGDHERRTDLMVAAEEAFINIATHAYTDGGDIEVAIEARSGEISLTLMDEGIPFDPGTVPRPDLEAAPEDRAIGSLGVHLIYSLVDAVRYRREGGRNVLTLVVHIDGDEVTKGAEAKR